MRAKSSASKIVLLALCATPFLGCERAGSRRPVSGTVTFQGEPLKLGRIQLLDDAGPAGGALIRDGAFRLPAEQGLLPGTYRLWISATEPLPGPPPKGMSSPSTRELIPPEFNAQTTQTFTVTDKGPNVLSINIPAATPKH